MASQQDNYQLLVEKLDKFIRKYYVNNIIRGSLHSVALLCALFITFTLLEYYFFTADASSVQLRQGLYYSFWGISAVSILYWVVWPSIQYFRLGRVISHEQAAQIIGQHFQDVKDKLLNVLQLRQRKDYAEVALIQASVNQKIGELKPVPFRRAIDLTENRKYIRFALPPILLILGLLLTSNIIQSSTSRLIRNTEEFEREAPFQFIVENTSDEVLQYDDYTIDVKVEGEVLPNEAFIEIDNYRYKLEKKEANRYSYTFNKLQGDVSYRLTASGVNSKTYRIDVLEKPNILGFDVVLDYPTYTGRKDEQISNVGDLVVPVGTNIDWLFNANFTKRIEIQFMDGARKEAVRKGENQFEVDYRVQREGQYKVFISNDFAPNADSVVYNLTVVPDLYPTIQVEQFTDSLNEKTLFFAGEVSDDYGLRRLNFHYELTRENTTTEKEVETIALTGGKQSTYNHILDIRTLNLKPGDRLSYYFEVFDNDAVHGSKSSRSANMVYQMPTVKELEDKAEGNNAAIKENLEKAMKSAQQFNKDVKSLRQNLLQKQNTNWQDRKEVERLLDQHEALEEELNEAKQKLEENIKAQEEFDEVSEELLEKQEQLDELMDELMSEEMKKMLEEMHKLMDQMDKNQLMDKLEDMEMSDEQLEQNLDRMLNLFKEFEVEKKLEDITQKMDELAEKQEALSEETEQGKKSEEELQKEQEEINEAFDELRKEMEDLKEKNEELENPKDLGDTQSEEEDIQQDMQQSQQQLQQKQKQGASKSQKNASKKMSKLSEKLKKQMQAGKQKQMQEDAKAMRQLLENLVDLSMEQEVIIDETNKTIPNTPSYTKLVQKQFKLKDDFRHIEDSLQALSKRVFEIKGFVTKKVAKVKQNIKLSVEELEERRKRPASVAQQITMTNVNDLALMLSQSMEQMQQQMAQQMDGQQMCENPGNGKPGQGDKPKSGKGGMPSMQQMQQQLNDQIEQLKQQIQNGKNPRGMSKEFAKAAAKQAALRKALREMKQQMQEEGKGEGAKALEEILKQMDQNETDLVNRRIPNKQRREDILTRLLEAENAEREREYDKKREAQTGSEKTRKMPPSMEEYLRERNAQVEQFKTVSPALKPFYKNLVEQYFNALK